MTLLSFKIQPLADDATNPLRRNLSLVVITVLICKPAGDVLDRKLALA